MRKGPPRRAFNVPTDSPAVSKVSNPSEIAISSEVSSPNLLAATCVFIKVLTASSPYLANVPCMLANSEAIIPGCLPISSPKSTKRRKFSSASSCVWPKTSVRYSYPSAESAAEIPNLVKSVVFADSEIRASSDILLKSDTPVPSATNDCSVSEAENPKVLISP